MQVRRAVDAFRNAGASIKLVSLESLSVVRTTAIQCGIHRPNQDLNAILLKGEEFKNFSMGKRMEKVDRIFFDGKRKPF
ncbi:hypothetical protein BVC80_8227g4 [Macleaya cordata]|uniref:Uncharacterized protein n=1 Tax=Macleaya cordata TaxID=56857 RepID=A0A200QFE5_MACCD|nr:hypothetical protein BVC80_8227g4 [Macleaya cordata]